MPLEQEASPEDARPVVAGTTEFVWTQSRRDILAGLHNHHADCAALYQGVLELRYVQTTFPGRARLIAHGVREIMSNISRVISDHVGGTLDYKDKVNPILDLWERALFPLAEGAFPDRIGEASTLARGIDVPLELMETVRTLLLEHLAAGTRAEIGLRMYKKLNPATSESEWKPQGAMWKSTHDYFTALSHRKDPVGDVVLMDQTFDINFDHFETLLAAIFNKFYDVMDGIDEILQATNA